MNRDENLDTDIAELTAKAHRVREALAASRAPAAPRTAQSPR